MAEGGRDTHRAYQPYRPAANLLLSKKWDDAAYDLHRSKVRESRTYLDTTAPKTYMHLQLKLKKLQVEEERLAIVERDNRMLLEKMATIMRTRGRVDHRNDYEHKSLNREKRHRELMEVAQQNQAILRRIQARQANYSHEEQQRDYFQSEEFRASITRFPDPNATTRRANKTGKGQNTGHAEEDDGGAAAPASPSPPPAQKTKTPSPPPPAKAASPPPPKAASPPPAAPAQPAPPPPAAASPKAPRAPVPAGRPSLTAAAGFDPVAAAQALRKAMKGLGTDEKEIVKVIGHCSHQQRAEIVKAYTSTIQRDLIADLKSELSGEFLKLTLALFQSPDDLTADFLASCIKHSNSEGVVAVLSLTSPADIEGVRAAYEARHGGVLADAVAGVVDGPLKSVLAAWCTGSRDATASVDSVEASSVAVQIASDESTILVEESLLLTTMTVVAPAQLCAVAGEFAKAKGYSLMESVERAGFQAVSAVLKQLLAAGENATAVAAEMVHRAIEGWGTDDEALIWLVVSRCEKDLVSVADKYKELYGASMVQDIKGDTSGDYESLLLALVNGQ